MTAIRRSLRSLILLGMVVLLSWNVSMAQKAPVRSLDHRSVYERGGRAQAFKTPPTISAYRLDEVEPNNTVEDAQVLSGPLPLTVNGMAEVGDEGDLVIPFSDGTMDDIEDLYQITTTTLGLAVVLDAFTSDCDLYLFTAEGDSVLTSSLAIGTTVEDPANAEGINILALPVGTYLIGVSIFDPDPGGADTTAYTLTVSEASGLPGGAEVEPNNDLLTAQALAGDLPISVAGEAQVADVGIYAITFDDGTGDDLEDLFVITTTTTGLRITLDNFTSDCDLYLLNSDVTDILALSNAAGATIAEEISEPTLAPGTYIIGVTIYDPDPGGADTTAYVLTLFNPTATATTDEPGAPTAFTLAQNYPNPFNPETRIAYELPTRASVRLEIFNTLGQKVRTLVAAEQPPGTHTVVWDGRDEAGAAAATGVYLYRLQAGAFVQSRTLVLLR